MQMLTFVTPTKLNETVRIRFCSFSSIMLSRYWYMRTVIESLVLRQLHVHSDGLKSLHAHVPRRCLPPELGGTHSMNYSDLAGIFFFCGSGSGCPATIFCKVSFVCSEPIEPYWESNRTCQPDPGRGVKHPIPRGGKGEPGFGIERAPSREGVSALDHQATPAAYWQVYVVHLISKQWVRSRVSIPRLHVVRSIHFFVSVWCHNLTKCNLVQT